MLAEVDLGEDGALPPGPAPVPWLREVSDDPRYEGGSLAATGCVPHRA